MSLTAEVQSEDLIARNQALEACRPVLNVSSLVVCLVVFRKLVDRAAFGRGHRELNGGGLLLVFAELRVVENRLQKSLAYAKK